MGKLSPFDPNNLSTQYLLNLINTNLFLALIFHWLCLSTKFECFHITEVPHLTYGLNSPYIRLLESSHHTSWFPRDELSFKPKFMMYNVATNFFSLLFVTISNYSIIMILFYRCPKLLTLKFFFYTLIR